jgi:lumazine binding protein
VFTGIVREVGRVEAVEERGESVRLVVRAPETASATAIGDSVSLAGVCLTAVEVADGAVAFDAVPETLRRSTLGHLEEGGGFAPAIRSAATSSRDTSTESAGSAGSTTRESRSRLPPKCSATASRRARSRSRASA